MISKLYLKYWPVTLFLAVFLVMLLAYAMVFELWFLLIAFLAVPALLLFVWRPLLGFCLLVLFIPLEDLTVLLPSMTLIKIIGVATFWGFLMQVLMGKKFIKFHSLMLVILAYLIWCALSVCWSIQPEQSVQRIVSLLQLLAMFVLGYNLVEEKQDLYYIIGSFIIGAFLAAGLGIYNGYIHEFNTRAVICNLQNPNFYARLLGIGILLGCYLIYAVRNKYIRTICVIACLAMFFAVLLSGSRGAWLAFFFSMAAGVWLFRGHLLKRLKLKHILVGTMVILLLTVALSSIFTDHLPSVIIKRAQTFSELTDDRGTGRLDIWMVGLEITKHNLIKGVGIDNFPYAYREYFAETEGISQGIGMNKNPHNIFLATVAELGLPGLVLFITLYILLWRMGSQTQSFADGVLCKLLVVFMVVAGLTGAYHHSKLYWLVMMIPVILSRFGILQGRERQGSGIINIVFLSPIFPNQQSPNYGIFAFRLAQNLQQCGVSVVAIAPVPYAPVVLWWNKKWRQLSQVPLRETIEGVEVIHPRFLCLPGGKFDAINGTFMYWAIFPVVKLLHHKYKFDLMHSYSMIQAGYVGQLIASKLNLITVCTAIGDDVHVFPFKSNVLMARTKFVMTNAAGIVAVGEDLANKASRLIIDHKEIIVIYNGVDRIAYDTTGIDRSEAKLKLGYDYRDRIILFVGRLVRHKGVYELVNAFNQLSEHEPNLKLAIVGSGVEKESLMALVKEKGIGAKVTFWDEVPNKELVWWYAASELVALLSYFEGVPNVVKEAMSSGRPVVATETTGTKELVIEGKTGFLVTPGDVGGAAEALKKILSNADLAQEMGRNAREFIHEKWLDWKQTGRHYRQLYESLTRGKRK